MIQKHVSENVGVSDTPPALTGPLNPFIAIIHTPWRIGLLQKQRIPSALRKEDLQDGRGLSSRMALWSRPLSTRYMRNRKQSLVEAVCPT